MSIKWTEYDPYSGVKETNWSYDDDDYVHVKYEQDVQPLLDLTAESRNTKAADDQRRGIRKYCSIPVTVQHELLTKGINVFNPDHMPRVLAEINANYPHLKYTDKTHSLTPKPKVTSLLGLPDLQKQEASTTPGPLLIVR